MTKDEHRIKRARPDDSAEQFECVDCGETFRTEERLWRHREREKRNQLRESVVGRSILQYNERRH